jgi:hypothetical protein
MCNKWLDIETAPKDGTAIDLWCVHETDGAVRLADARWSDTLKCWTGPIELPLNPGWVATSWMPLPLPPPPAAASGAPNLQDRSA